MRREVLFNVSESRVLASNIEMPANSEGIVQIEEFLPANWMPTFMGKTLQITTKLRTASIERMQITTKVNRNPYNPCK